MMTFAAASASFSNDYFETGIDGAGDGLFGSRLLGGMGLYDTLGAYRRQAADVLAGGRLDMLCVGLDRRGDDSGGEQTQQLVGFAYGGFYALCLAVGAPV